MRIHIPNSAWLGNIDQFLRSFDNSQPDILEITANKQWFSVHPVVLAMIGSLGLSCQPKNILCEQLESKSRHYLKRMGLFDLLKIDSGINIHEHESAGRFIPLTIINQSDNLTKFITDTIPLLHLATDQAEPIKYILSELIRNVFEHAISPVGAIVSAQYYKKSNTIRIGIVDRGIGIKKAINLSHHAIDDKEAIKLALTPGITGTTRRIGGTDYNAGAGLFFIKSIAKVNRDFFMIYSGNAMYKLLKTKAENIHLQSDPWKDKHSSAVNLPYWQGTVVGVDMVLDEKKEFSDLLKLISEIYSKSIRDRKKEFYKQARFI